MSAAEPDLEALRAVVLTAELGSITAASGQLGVSQQALSLRIRALERSLQVPLLVRTARGSKLTAAGELVVGWARPLLTAADDFVGAAATLRSARGGSFRIAASLTIAEHLLPEWLVAWRAELGDDCPVVRLTAANSAAVVDAVRAGAADLGFIETPHLPVGLQVVQVAQDRIEVVAQADHSWADGGPVPVAELAETSLVLRETGSGTREALETALQQAGFPQLAEPAAVLSTTLGVRSTIMAGVAPGALSSLAVAEDLRTGRLVRVAVDGLTIRRPLSAIWAGSRPSRLAAGFLEVIRDGRAPAGSRQAG